MEQFLMFMEPVGGKQWPRTPKVRYLPLIHVIAIHFAVKQASGTYSTPVPDISIYFRLQELRMNPKRNGQKQKVDKHQLNQNLYIEHKHGTYFLLMFNRNRK